MANKKKQKMTQYERDKIKKEERVARTSQLEKERRFQILQKRRRSDPSRSTVLLSFQILFCLKLSILSRRSRKAIKDLRINKIEEVPDSSEEKTIRKKNNKIQEKRNYSLSSRRLLFDQDKIQRFPPGIADPFGIEKDLS